MLNRVPLPLAIDREPPNPGSYQAAGSNDRTDCLIEDTLAQEVAVHLAAHLIPTLAVQFSERILLILGLPGNGKTFSVKVLASRLKYELLTIPGALLGGALEGAPVDTIRQAFAWMRWHSARNELPFALLLDDLDTSILAERPDQERTSNTNALIGLLQAIANDAADPNYATADGRPIPIIASANDATHFRASLLREGRTRIHRHVLDWEVKACIVAELYHVRTAHERRVVRDLVWKHRDKPVAFFSMLRRETTRKRVADVIARDGGLKLESLQQAVSHSRTDFEALHLTAQRLRANTRTNYLSD